MSGAAPAPSPLLGETDLWLFAEGNHRRLWELLGARPRVVDGASGTAFAVWAPNARRVSVIGDWNGWDGARHPLAPAGSGVWAAFVPGVGAGALYKLRVEGADGVVRLKSDPLGRFTEQFPGYASIVQGPAGHAWTDGAWMDALPARDPRREPLSIYEVHLGSWIRSSSPHGDRPLTYREIAPRLAEHVAGLGFTHVELLPVMEHPFGGSWGYQVTGFFAPTSRYGTPDDLRSLVDTLHGAGLGVILDWVPAHFPGDEHGLARFDGTALYEHEDPRRGHHPDWDTLIFNFGRHEVRNFLIASALHWLDEFHVDGLRVDAVASMLYLDYSRAEGQWLPNRFGGRENLEAIEFLKALTGIVRDEHPGRLVIAEESTSWPGVTAPLEQGGLGFTFKWNLGWMHDTLDYFSTDPLYRGHHQDKLTFAQLYEHSERFVMSLSHDECVHGKGSLLSRMPGDEWQQLANLRLLLAWQFLRPGKKLLFMGTELAPRREWDHDLSLDWDLAHDPARRAIHRWMADLGRLYRDTPCLWEADPDPHAFEWISCDDRTQSVLAFLRWNRDFSAHLLVAMNMTPVPRHDYRVGVPVPAAAGGAADPARYEVALCSDDEAYGGSAVEVPRAFDVEPQPCHGRPASVRLAVPPLGAVVLRPASPRGTAAPAPPRAGRDRQR